MQISRTLAFLEYTTNPDPIYADNEENGYLSI